MVIPCTNFSCNNSILLFSKLPTNNLLEAKDFLIRHNVDVETLIIKNCDHHIPIEASSVALNFIKKNLINS